MATITKSKHEIRSLLSLCYWTHQSAGTVMHSSFVDLRDSHRLPGLGRPTVPHFLPHPGGSIERVSFLYSVRKIVFK